MNNYMICDNCLNLSKSNDHSDNLCEKCYFESNWDNESISYKINYFFNKLFKCYQI